MDALQERLTKLQDLAKLQETPIQLQVSFRFRGHDIQQVILSKKET